MIAAVDGLTGFSEAINSVSLKAAGKSCKRSITISVLDTMIIGNLSFEMKLNEINDIAFVDNRATGIIHDYRLLVRFTDGKDRFLVDEDVLLMEW